MSSPATVPLVQVWDQEYAGGGSATTAPAISGRKVKAQLSFAQATYSNPVVGIATDPVSTTTDANGYWTMYLAANDLINPSGTLWAIQVEGEPTYLINVISTGVPVGGWQSSAIVVNTPAALGSTSFNIPGGATVQGALGVNGLLTASDLTDSALTAGRLPYADTGGHLATDATLTFNKTTKVLGASDVNVSGQATVQFLDTVVSPTGVAATDTANINTALAATYEVKLAPGTYKVAGTAAPALTTTGAQFVLRGAGLGKTIIQVDAASTTTSIFNYLGNRLDLSELTLDGNGVAGYGLFLDDAGGGSFGCYECSLRHVEITNCLGTPGYGIANADRAYSLNLDNVWSSHNNLGMYLIKRCQNINARASHFYNNLGVTLNGIATTQVHIGDGTSQDVNAVFFHQCDFEGITAGGTGYLVALSGVRSFDFTDCYVNSTGTGSGEFVLNGTGTHVTYNGRIAGVYGDSSSTATDLLTVQNGAVANVSLADIWLSSPTTTHSINDANASAGTYTVQNLRGAGLLGISSWVLGPPMLIGTVGQLQTVGGLIPRFYRTAASQQALGLSVVGDTADRFNVAANGTINWGPGTGAVDTTWARQGVGVVGPNSGTRILAPSAITVSGGPIIGNMTTEVFSGAVAITVDNTKGNTHLIPATSNTASTLTPSAGGTAGQWLYLVFTSDGTGGNVITFASTFRPNGTLTLGVSKKQVVSFLSDGTNWIEMARGAAV